MSRGFIKEGDQEAIPMVPPRAFLPEGVPNYVTTEGLAALHEELQGLEADRAKAGDNYIMANFIDAKMKLLIDRISSAVEVDLSKTNKDTVSFGAWVRYNGRVVRIVGVDEADVEKGLVSFTSPIAKALTGKKAGEAFELKGAGGKERITVEEVSFEPLNLTQIVREKPMETASATEWKGPKTVEKELVQGMAGSAPRHDEHADIIDPQANTESSHLTERSHPTEGSHLFEPEVNPMEFLPIVNERGNIVGRALYVELHQGNKMLHPVVHLHVINGKGATTGLYWWHVVFGDTPEKTLQRKLAETLGLSGVKPLLKRQYIREAKTEKELVYVFTLVTEEDLPKAPDRKDYLGLFSND